MFGRTDAERTHTEHTCDQCGHTYPEWTLDLEFSLFGASSVCPFCNEVTSFTEVDSGLMPEQRQHD